MSDIAGNVVNDDAVAQQTSSKKDALTSLLVGYSIVKRITPAKESVS